METVIQLPSDPAGAGRCRTLLGIEPTPGGGPYVAQGGVPGRYA